MALMALMIGDIDVLRPQGPASDWWPRPSVERTLDELTLTRFKEIHPARPASRSPVELNRSYAGTGASPLPAVARTSGRK